MASHLQEYFRGLLPPDRMLFNAPLRDYTTFRIGGPADVLAQPVSSEEVRLLLAAAKAAEAPVYVLGNGSNTLVRDGGLRGLVLHINRNLSRVEFTPQGCRAQAGVTLSALAKLAMAQGLSGLEFASGIPGCLGGAVCMNAGAYNGEIGMLVESALIIDDTWQIRRLNKQELGFAYRHTALTGQNAVVLEAELCLTPGDPAEIAAKIDDFTRRRKSRQPLQYPSAGSMFKRPEGGYAAELIDRAGLKGLTVGAAQVSQMHAGFFINLGGATAADVLALVEQVQQRVFRHSGIRLEPEVHIVGENTCA